MSYLTERFGYNLRLAYAAVISDLEGAFAEFDITPRQFGILALVDRNPGLNQGQVSEALGIARTNFVAMLDSLEERGFLKREPALQDRRSYALHLTVKGSTILDTLHDIDSDHEQKMRKLIGERDATSLLRLLTKLRKAVSET